MKNKIVRYKAKSGSQLTNRDAEIIGKRIETLMGDNKEVTPKQLIEDARRKTSPIHNFFQWDDTKAAELYRLEQARHLLRSIIEVVIIDGDKSEARSFYNVKNENKESVYVTLKSATTNTDYTKQLLEDAQRYVEHFLEVIKLLKQNWGKK